ncbi:MAG: cytochrome c oxidase assembly protein [Dehalococcoidia bacterium]|nr:cytochrome c oxidase assembly protein [Dehalococcoidia bacterium]
MPPDLHTHLDVLFWVALIEGAYLLAVFPLRKRYGWSDEVDPTRACLFSLGVAVIYLAEGTSLHDLSEKYLFSAHMVQHLMLTMAVPPLLLAGTPDWLARVILRPQLLFRLVKFLTYPVTAFLIFNAVLAFWHLPEFYDLTLSVHTWHIVEHLMFISAATIMWWPVMSPVPELNKLPYMGQMFYLFVQTFVPIVIGGIATFADQMVYHGYVNAPRLWGISAAADQQIGGMIMKIAGTLILLVAMTVIFFTWFNEEDAESPHSKPLKWEEVEDELATMGLTKKQP